MSLKLIVIALAITASLARSQSFDVASTKPAPPVTGIPRISGGPGTADPGRITWESIELKRLLMRAYGIESDQMIGPGWIDSEKYAVVATFPPGTAEDLFRIMLRNLLTERFRITLHHEAKELSLYELVVATSGPKMAVATDPDPGPPNPDDADTRIPRNARDSEGCPLLRPGASGVQVRIGGPRVVCSKFGSVSMPAFARRLEMMIGLESWGSTTHVIDKTGLNGEFAFKLKYLSQGVILPGMVTAPTAGVVGDPEEASGPDLYTAVEQQLGLKLQKTKGMIDRIVIDQATKVPTDN